MLAHMSQWPGIWDVDVAYAYAFVYSQVSRTQQCKQAAGVLVSGDGAARCMPLERMVGRRMVAQCWGVSDE